MSNLGVMDMGGPDDTMRLLSVHPGVTVEQIQEATGFELHVDGDVPASREPGEGELMLIREMLDPKGIRFKEVARAEA